MTLAPSGSPPTSADGTHRLPSAPRPGRRPRPPAEPRPDPQLNSPAAAQHTHRNKEATQASDNPNESTIDDARIRELMLMNRFAVFNQRDPERRLNAIAANYT